MMLKLSSFPPPTPYSDHPKALWDLSSLHLHPPSHHIPAGSHSILGILQKSCLYLSLFQCSLSASPRTVLPLLTYERRWFPLLVLMGNLEMDSMPFSLSFPEFSLSSSLYWTLIARGLSVEMVRYWMPFTDSRLNSHLISRKLWLLDYNQWTRLSDTLPFNMHRPFLQNLHIQAACSFHQFFQSLP